jgi:hypothetical protein
MQSARPEVGNMKTELGRVKKRMWAQGYPPNDKLQLLVLQAFDVMQELRMHCQLYRMHLEVRGCSVRPTKQSKRIE